MLLRLKAAAEVSPTPAPYGSDVEVGKLQIRADFKFEIKV